jgi:molybdate transport system substrate-binding protein
VYNNRKAGEFPKLLEGIKPGTAILYSAKMLRKPLGAGRARERLTAILLLVLHILTVQATGCSDGDSTRKERPILVVFVAASLRDVVQEIGTVFAHKQHIDLVYNFAGSNILAQQIKASRSADVFLSANVDWIDFLEKANLIVPGSRRNFLSNRLVVVSRMDAHFQFSNPRELATLNFSFLALADPEAVPAGRYAKAFLESVELDGGSLWQALKDKVAPTADVRAALGLVESDPLLIGVVYRTDVTTSDKIKLLYEVPQTLHPAITYCAVALKDRLNGWLVEEYLDFLSTPQAAAVYKKHGFLQETRIVDD